MTLILRLLLKAAFLFSFLSQSLRECFRLHNTGGGSGGADAPPYGKDHTGQGGSAGRRGKDPYVVLGCTPSSSNEEIKKKYRELLGKYRTSRFIGQKLDEVYSAGFKEVSEIREA